MSCSCINLSNIQSQISSLLNTYSSLRQNSNLPSTDSGYLPQSTQINQRTLDTSFDDNLSFAFYVIMAIVGLFVLGSMVNSRKRRATSKLNWFYLNKVLVVS